MPAPPRGFPDQPKASDLTQGCPPLRGGRQGGDPLTRGEGLASASCWGGCGLGHVFTTSMEPWSPGALPQPLCHTDTRVQQPLGICGSQAGCGLAAGGQLVKVQTHSGTPSLLREEKRHPHRRRSEGTGPRPRPTRGATGRERGQGGPGASAQRGARPASRTGLEELHPAHVSTCSWGLGDRGVARPQNAGKACGRKLGHEWRHSRPRGPRRPVAATPSSPDPQLLQLFELAAWEDSVRGTDTDVQMSPSWPGV